MRKNLIIKFSDYVKKLKSKIYEGYMREKDLEEFDWKWVLGLTSTKDGSWKEGFQEPGGSEIIRVKVKFTYRPSSKKECL